MLQEDGHYRKQTCRVERQYHHGDVISRQVNLYITGVWVKWNLLRLTKKYQSFISINRVHWVVTQSEYYLKDKKERKKFKLLDQKYIKVFWKDFILLIEWLGKVCKIR